MDPDLLGRSEDLPLFPLPRLVLLPTQLLPLHVFEPRYRALVEHCLATDRLLGLATLRDGTEHDAVPAIHDLVGIGRIVRHQSLPDGRSNLLLAYVGALRVAEELEVDTPFRRVRGTLLEEPETAPPSASLRPVAMQLLAQIGPIGPTERLLQLEGIAFVNALAQIFLQDPDARLAYLAGDGPARVAQVEDALLERLAAGLSDDDLT